MHLISLIFTLDIEINCHIWFQCAIVLSSTSSSCKAIHGFVHVVFLASIVSKINAWHLFKIVNERQAFWTHHLLVSRGED